MPDISGLKWNTPGPATVNAMKLALYQDAAPTCKTANMPELTVEFQIKNSQNQAVLADYTAANAVRFPQCLDSMSATEKRALLLIIKDFIVQWKVRQHTGEEPLEVI